MARPGETTAILGSIVGFGAILIVGVAAETIDFIGVPRGIRTPVTAVKGRCPGPLDDGDR